MLLSQCLNVLNSALAPQFQQRQQSIQQEVITICIPLSAHSTSFVWQRLSPSQHKPSREPFGSKSLISKTAPFAKSASAQKAPAHPRSPTIAAWPASYS